MLTVWSDGIPFKQKFDVIYAVAVFAHIISDVELKKYFIEIFDHLKPGGVILVFEQTGIIRKSGLNWIRRSSEEYVSLALECGYEIEKRILLAQPVHRKLENIIFPLYRKIFCRGDSDYQRAIVANNHILYKFISRILLIMSGSLYHKDDGSIDGNTFYVFRKK